MYLFGLSVNFCGLNFFFCLHGGYIAALFIAIFKRKCKFSTQLAYDVRTTLYGRWYDVKALKRHPYNVVLTSFAGWGRPFWVLYIESVEGTYPAGKIAEKAMWRSVFLTIWHHILNVDSTKPPSSSATFKRFFRLGNLPSMYNYKHSKVDIINLTSGYNRIKYLVLDDS